MNKQKLAEKIMETIEIIIEAAQYMEKFYKNYNYKIFYIISDDMEKLLQCVYDKILKLDKQNKIKNIGVACESIIDSLNRILKLSFSHSELVLSKIEFELIPLLKEMRLNFYFWNDVYPNKDKIKNYCENEMIFMSGNKYIDISEKQGKYKYDISIVVIGYNKREYTKICVENILKYVPQDLDYELILVNHGSTDGTKEYFESISPTKQLDILKNGGGLASISRIVEGKYSLVVSNDVIITENAISNMFKCIDSDEKIAWVVPTTPNVSNLQNIPANYNTIEEMYEFSRKNNVSSKYRWEQRVRLCNPVTMTRNKICYSSNGVQYHRYYLSSALSFPDDKASLLLRRKGYKLVLAKDAYCYHFGSVTLDDKEGNTDNKNQKKSLFYNEGRKEFQEIFGIDPWGIGFCYDYNLFQYLDCNDKEPVNILGINCGMGSNPLKVRETIKEKVHNLNAKIYNITDDKSFLEDLRGVSDYVSEVITELDIEKSYNDIKFDYIIFESNMENYKMDSLIYILKKKLTISGVLCILNTKMENAQRVESGLYEGASWYIFKK